MEQTQFSKFINRYCRFKLRSGKEVFGIIWENAEGNKVIHYFASALERKRIAEAEMVNDLKTVEQHRVKVNIEEIIAAEPLS